MHGAVRALEALLTPADLRCGSFVDARIKSVDRDLAIAFDMPTLYGYDTDDPRAEGEFGTCGVAVSSLADMELLLDGLPLDRISTSMTINSPAAPIWAMYIVAAERRGHMVRRDRVGRAAEHQLLQQRLAGGDFVRAREAGFLQHAFQHLGVLLQGFLVHRTDALGRLG